MITLLPLWLLVLWLPFAFGLARYFYKRKEWVSDLSKRLRFGFIGLRFLVLSVIGMLLIGIMLESINYREEKPMLITVVDNSKSMMNDKDNGRSKKDILNTLNSLQEKFGNRFEIVKYSVSDKVKSFHEKDLFIGEKTNLSTSFKHITDLYSGKNIGGVLLISDGNFNTGSSPIYAAEKLKFTPIFCLGVGDTVTPKDQLIRTVMSNEIAFLKNKFPIEVDLETYKLNAGSSRVSVELNGKEVASQMVAFKGGDYEYKRISFLVESNTIGVNSIKVKLASRSGEYSLINNSYTSYIEILDARSKVLILSGAPHPDVAALRSALESDVNIQVDAKLTKNWDKSLIDVDFIVWHELGINFDKSNFETIKKSKKPLLFIIGTGTSQSVISNLGLGFSVPSNSKTEEVVPIINESFENFVLDPALGEIMKYYPPVKVRYGEVKPPNGAEVVLFQGVGDVQKKSPILFFSKNENGRIGVFVGDGIWRWKMSEQLKTGNQFQFNGLFNSVRQYLTVRENSSSLRVSPPKRIILGEECLFKAEFYNDALELITTPKIGLIVKDEKGNKFTYDFAAFQNFYNLRFSGLKSGTYTWEASTNYKGKNFKKNGTFSVEDLKLEGLDVYANHAVLKQLAENSKGEYRLLKEANQILQLIEKRQDISTIQYKESVLNNLIDFKLLFAILFLMLGLEWFGRRWFGGY
jgi:hypothetical protein